MSYGAAPMGSKIAVKVKGRLGLHQLQQGYGLTEVGITHVAPVGTVLAVRLLMWILELRSAPTIQEK